MRTLIAVSVSAFLAGCATTHPIEPRVAAATTDFGQAETIEITLSNFEFTPSELTLAAGRPYVLKIVNAASGGHDFTAPDFFAAATIAPDDATRIADGQIELQGGETALLHIIPAAGQYGLICTHFGHAALGMKGKIIVH